jgi:hypothetical protein
MGAAKRQTAGNDEMREDVGLTMSAMVKRLDKGQMVLVGSQNERDVAERFAATRERLTLLC